MLQATPAFKEVCLEMSQHTERWDVSGLFERIKENPALCVECRSYKEYHGLNFEMGMRLKLADLAKDPRFEIAPCVGDYQPYFGSTYPGDCIENFGRVYLSGSGLYTRTTEYDSVILLRGNAFVLEATVAYQKALERTDPANIERHLSPLKKRLDRDFGYAIVCISKIPKGLSSSARSKIRDFESRGGMFVAIPLSIHGFCNEVDEHVKKAGFPVYKSIQCAPAIASWYHVKTKEKRNRAKSLRDKEFRIHERKTIEMLEQRLGWVSHAH